MFVGWFKGGYVLIFETTISNAAIGWGQDSKVMTSYNKKKLDTFLDFYKAPEQV